jgi:hypothetical protein
MNNLEARPQDILYFPSLDGRRIRVVPPRQGAGAYWTPCSKTAGNNKFNREEHICEKNNNQY